MFLKSKYFSQFVNQVIFSMIRKRREIETFIQPVYIVAVYVLSEIIEKQMKINHLFKKVVSSS
jgi:hypothetical protein